MKLIALSVIIIALSGCKHDKTGGDLNKVVDMLSTQGFSNICLKVEKNGHLFEVDLHGRTNASLRYLGQLVSVPQSAPETYTVAVGEPRQIIWQHTNCVFVGRCPDGDGSCTLVKYVDGGVTNEFHAWLAPLTVVTNR